MRSPREFHLWPVPFASGCVPGRGEAAAGAAPLRLPDAPAWLDNEADPPSVGAWPESAAAGGVGLEPFHDGRQQHRLLAHFPPGSAPRVNGEAAPSLVVLAPGDFFQTAPGFGFTVALFCHPQVGAPPAGVVGRPCPFCRVPFAATATTFTCGCGAVLHCEVDAQHGLQCAQMSQACPVCKRPIALEEGYVTPLDEDQD